MSDGSKEIIKQWNRGAICVISEGHSFLISNLYFVSLHAFRFPFKISIFMSKWLQFLSKIINNEIHL